MASSSLATSLSLCLLLSHAFAISPLNDILTEVGYNADEIQRIRDGELLQDTVESGSERELAVRFALLVESPAKELHNLFITSSQKKENDLSVTGLGLIENDSVDDFEGLDLVPNTEDAIKALMKASPGTDLNLSQDEMESLNSTSDAGQVVKQFRQMLFERYRAYREKGIEGIAPYRRSKGKDYYPMHDLKRKTELAHTLKKESPSFHRHLSEYPQSRPDRLEEKYSWVNFEIDGKPTIALVHKMSLDEGNAFVFCERHFYVSRSYNCFQGIGGAFPVDEGTVILYLVRTTTDQVAGFGSSAKRAIGARIMGSQMAQILERARMICLKKDCQLDDPLCMK